MKEEQGGSHGRMEEEQGRVLGRRMKEKQERVLGGWRRSRGKSWEDGGDGGGAGESPGRMEEKEEEQEKDPEQSVHTRLVSHRPTREIGNR